MRRLILFVPITVFVIALMNCDDSDVPVGPVDAGTTTPTIDSGPTDPPADASKNDAKTPLTSCVDRPNTLQRPPSSSNRLPCELVPPGLTL